MTPDVLAHMLRLPSPSNELFLWYKKLQVVCKAWYKAVKDVHCDVVWLKPFVDASNVCADRLYDISGIRTELTTEDIAFVGSSMTCYQTMQAVQLDACYLLARVSHPLKVHEHLQTANVVTLVLAAMRTYNSSPSWTSLAAQYACGALHVLCDCGLVEGPAVAESLVQIRGILARRHIDFGRSRAVIRLLMAMRSDEMLAAMSQHGLVASIVPHMELWQEETDITNRSMHNHMMLDGLRFLKHISVASTHNSARVCAEGGARVAVAALHESQEHLIQRAGLEVLDALLPSTAADNRAAAKCIVECGGAPALESVVAETATDDWLRRECLDTVRRVQDNLCRRCFVTVL